ncbi:hypothetical protein [Ramlibacter tataouinensis]|nr:hypothetical protein [Ramlibacter tataouinensis]
MTYRMSKLTQTQQGVVLRLGPVQADELLRAEIAAVVPKYQDKWDQNLAQAWAPLMSAEEFKSIADKRQQSPFASKFLSMQNQAGATMQSTSEPLLTEVVSEVMGRVWEKASKGK